MQAQEMLTATHKLEESGMTQPQAEAIASTIVDAIEPLATKEDLRNTEKAIRSDFQSSMKELRTDLETSIKEVRTDLESSINEVRIGLETLEKNCATKADILSMKVWLLTWLLGLGGSALLAWVGAFVFILRATG